VFNTAMTGYQEILTDPSYAGQIVTLTYSAHRQRRRETGGRRNRTASVAGSCIRDLPRSRSSWRAAHAQAPRPTHRNIVGIADIDTRSRRRMLRDAARRTAASSRGQARRDAESEAAIARARSDPVDGGPRTRTDGVSRTQPYEWTTSTWALGAGYRPTGRSAPSTSSRTTTAIKHNILRMHAARGCRITSCRRRPRRDVLAMKPDGVFLSNGPGDPEPCDYAIDGDPRDRRDRHADVSASALAISCSASPRRRTLR
jgi:carbamoyl-phosphate synthase small subunit